MEEVADKHAEADREDKRGGEIVLHGLLGLMCRVGGKSADAPELSARVSSRACRKLLAPGGSVLVVDERVADAFVAPGDQVERLMYGFSILCCLPAGMADQPSAATGTVMRVGTLERYAAEAGLGRTEVLPIANDFFRFYRLRP